MDSDSPHLVSNTFHHSSAGMPSSSYLGSGIPHHVPPPPPCLTSTPHTRTSPTWTFSFPLWALPQHTRRAFLGDSFLIQLGLQLPTLGHSSSSLSCSGFDTLCQLPLHRCPPYSDQALTPHPSHLFSLHGGPFHPPRL